MKKIVDDNRLIFKCCYLYYMDGYSQFEICERLGISRATVSRLLKAGKEKGIVRIELDNPDGQSYGELESKLESLFGLKEIIIVDEIDLGNTYEISQKVYKEAINYLSRIINDNDYVGVSMGKTLLNLANTSVEPRNINCTFVPVIGGVGRGGAYNFHANEIATLFAKKFKANALQLFAPAVFDNVNVMNGLMKEPSLADVFGSFKQIKACICGIGSVESKSVSSIVESGYLSKDQYEQYKQAGFVGDVLLHLFDKDGNEEKFADYNTRVLGMSTEEFMKVERRIAVAVGKEKARAVVGALRSKRINVLITDIDCAERIIKIMEEDNDGTK